MHIGTYFYPWHAGRVRVPAPIHHQPYTILWSVQHTLPITSTPFSTSDFTPHPALERAAKNIQDTRMILFVPISLMLRIEHTYQYKSTLLVSHSLPTFRERPRSVQRNQAAVAPVGGNTFTSGPVGAAVSSSGPSAASASAASLASLAARVLASAHSRATCT